MKKFALNKIIASAIATVIAGHSICGCQQWFRRTGLHFNWLQNIDGFRWTLELKKAK